ncbi:MAG: hypothetical protein FWF38_03590 [Spirochaetaceae bacterium]|nr:hypothetical protein [Spirochaetaceae bacterium]
MSRTQRIFGAGIIILLAAGMFMTCNNQFVMDILPDRNNGNVVIKAGGAVISGKPVVSDSETPTQTVIVVDEVDIPDNPGGQTVEYAISTDPNADPSSLTWQDDTTFNGLTGGTKYYVYARSKSNNNHNEGTPMVSDPITTLEKNTGEAVSGAPTVSSVTYNSIVVNAVTIVGGNPGGQTVEYAISTVNNADPSTLTWQGGTIFNGLTGGATYYVYARSKSNATHDAGVAQSSVVGITTRSVGAAVSGAPIVNGTPTENSITINAVTIVGGNPGGQTVEYAISTVNNADPSALTWQGGVTTFIGLIPSTTYYVYARSASNGPYDAGEAQVSVGITTAVASKVPGADVSQPVVSGAPTHNSITVIAVTIPTNPGGQDVEYAISTDDDTVPASGWQSGTTFSGLNVATTYYVYARSKENSTHGAGIAQFSAGITTLKNIGAIVNGAPALDSKTHNSITVNAVTILTNPGSQNVEYAISTDGDTVPAIGWQTGTTFSGLTAVTTYYIYARSEGNTTYYAGVAQVSVGITTDKAPGATVSAPTLDSKTHNSITINAVSAPDNGQSVEYGINTNGSTTPDSGWEIDKITFSGVSSNTTYYVLARSAENASYNAGAVSVSAAITTATTPKAPGANVSQPVVSGDPTHNSITVSAVTIPTNPGSQNAEYAISTDDDIVPVSGWQTGTTFSGLNAATTYYVYARSEENLTHDAGVAQISVEITTDKAPGAAVSGAPTVNGTPNHNSITVNAVTIPSNPGSQNVEYAISTVNNADPSILTWQSGTIFSGLNAVTTYYVYARSEGNTTYYAGVEQISAGITTAVASKALGANVSQPVVSGVPTHDSITVSAVSLQSVTGQSIEYAISTDGDVDPSTLTWQSGTTFSGLYSNTTYYVLARSAENPSYNAGAVSVSDPIDTLAAPKSTGAAVNITVGTVTATSITVSGSLIPDTAQSILYAISESGSTAPDSGWQSSPTFTVTPNTTHYVWAYSVEDASYYAGALSVSEAITTPKQIGAAVSGAPTVNGTPTEESITINAVTIPTNPGGQAVEYAISETSGATPISGWQTGLTFSGLKSNTTYYVYARSAANTNYNAGAALVSLGIKTKNEDIQWSGTQTANLVTFNSNSLISFGSGTPGWWLRDVPGVWKRGIMNPGSITLEVDPISLASTQNALSNQSLGSIGQFDTVKGSTQGGAHTEWTYSLRLALPYESIKVKITVTNFSGSNSIGLASARGEQTLVFEDKLEFKFWRGNSTDISMVIELESDLGWDFVELPEPAGGYPVFKQNGVNIYYWIDGSGQGTWSWGNIKFYEFNIKPEGASDTIKVNIHPEDPAVAKTNVGNIIYFFEVPGGPDMKYDSYSTTPAYGNENFPLYIGEAYIGTAKVTLLGGTPSTGIPNTVNYKVDYTLDSVFAAQVQSYTTTCSGQTKSGNSITFTNEQNGYIIFETEFTFINP